MGIVAKPIFLARVHHIEERFPILEVYGQVGADDGMLDKLYDFRIVCWIQLRQYLAACNETALLFFQIRVASINEPAPYEYGHAGKVHKCSS